MLTARESAWAMRLIRHEGPEPSPHASQCHGSGAYKGCWSGSIAITPCRRRARSYRHLWPQLKWPLQVVRFCDGQAALLPRLLALLQSGVVEFPTAAQDKLHRLLLLRSRLEFIFECLAYCLLFHSYLFCLIGRKPARGIGTFIPRSSRGVFCPLSVILCYVVWKLVYSVLHSMRS